MPKVNILGVGVDDVGKAELEGAIISGLAQYGLIAAQEQGRGLAMGNELRAMENEKPHYCLPITHHR